METSAKANINVHNLFKSISDQLYTTEVTGGFMERNSIRTHRIKKKGKKK